MIQFYEFKKLWGQLIVKSENQQRPLWRFSTLILGHAIAFILFFSWYNLKVRQYWDWIDLYFFEFFNQGLVGHDFLQALFAFFNHRSVDIFTAILMSFPIFHYLHSGKECDFSLRLSRTLSFFLYAFFALIFLKLCMKNIFSVRRLSPSLSVDFVVRLSSVFPWMTIKDASKNSFPGDHTTVLMIWAGFIYATCSWKYRIQAFFLVIIASFPRLISGAHWLSDDLVGGGVLCMIILSWAFASPICQHLSKGLHVFSVRLTRIYFRLRYLYWKKRQPS